MKLLNWVKGLWDMPPALDMAKMELAKAERELLEAQTGVEYAQAMVVYNTQRVERLRAFLESK